MTTEGKATKAVAKTEERALANVTAGLSVLQEALGPGERLDATVLEQVKNPTGGGKNWELSSGEATQTIEGVIMLRQAVRAFWKDRVSETGGGTPPDCASFDLLTGDGDNGNGAGNHDCEDCPQAQFESAVDDAGNPGAGQACKQVTRLFVLREGEILPVMMALAPTSYKEARRYTISLASRSKPLHSVVTRVGLDQKTSQGGHAYSFATLQTVRELDADELEAVEAYRTEMVPMLTQTAIESDG